MLFISGVPVNRILVNSPRFNISLCGLPVSESKHISVIFDPKKFAGCSVEPQFRFLECKNSSNLNIFKQVV